MLNWREIYKDEFFPIPETEDRMEKRIPLSTANMEDTGELF